MWASWQKLKSGRNKVEEWAIWPPSTASRPEKSNQKKSETKIQNSKFKKSRPKPNPDVEIHPLFNFNSMSYLLGSQSEARYNVTQPKMFSPREINPNIHLSRPQMTDTQRDATTT